MFIRVSSLVGGVRAGEGRKPTKIKFGNLMYCTVHLSPLTG